MLTNFPNGASSFGIPLLGAGEWPKNLGNTYIVANTADTNYEYLVQKFGSTQYEDGSQMLYSDLQSAINACVDLRGDRIIVGPHTYTVTTPVLFNKKGITVETAFSMSNEDTGERFQINSDTAAVAAATISEPCTLIGIGFDGGNASGGAVVLGPGSGFDGGNFTHFINCRWDNWGHSLYGVESSYNDYVKFTNCDFDGTINGVGGSANVFSYGIHVTQGHYVTIDNVTFRGCTYGIGHGTPNPATAGHSNTNFVYKNNVMIVSDSSANEKFIDFNTVATYTDTSGIVANNYLGVAVTAAYNDSIATIQASAPLVRFTGNNYEE